MSGPYKPRRRAVVGCVVGLLLACSPAMIAEEPPRAPALHPDEPATHSIPGFTQPFRSSTLGAERPGRIAELSVEEGDAVTANQVLARMSDAFQRARTERARIIAQSTLAIDQARVRHDYCAEELKRIEALAEASSAASREILTATTDAQATRILLDIAQLEYQEAKLNYEAEKASLDQLSIRSPFDGYVAERLSEVGEIVEESDKILEIVQIDRLLVICDVPVPLVQYVRLGDTLTVRTRDANWPQRQGRVVLVDRVADAASQTVRVKLEVANADFGWLAGMKVFVDLAPGSDAEKDSTTTTADSANARGPVFETGCRADR